MSSSFRLTSLCVALSLAGCSSFNPYQRTTVTDEDVVMPPRAAASASMVRNEGPPATDDGTGRPGRFAGGLQEALAAANSQRVEYFDSLASHTRTSNITTSLVYAFTAWGLYHGIKAGASSDSNLIAKAGIGAGASYSVGTFFLNDKHDTAYIAGFKALTCVMLRQRPYLLTAGNAGSDWNQLQDATRKLDEQVKILDAAVLKVQYEDGLRKNADTASARTVSAAIGALRRGRETLDRGHRFEQTVATSGFQLRRQTDLIVATISEEIRLNNKGIAEPGKLLADLQDITGKFQAIQPVPRADTDTADVPADSVTETSGATPKATPTPPPGAASAPITPADTMAPVMKALADIKEAILDPAKAKEKLKDQDGKAKAIQDIQKKLDASQAEVKKLEAEKAKVTAEVIKGTDRIVLMKQVADMYAARRVVNQYLSNQAQLGRAVRNVPECRPGGGSQLNIVPSDDMTVEQGKAYEFRITGAKGIPVVTLDGTLGTTAAEPLTVTLKDGAVVARFKLGTDAPAGTLHLVVQDGGSRASEDVLLTVPAPVQPKS